MLDKTKQINAKMMAKKELNGGSAYVTPESLGDRVGKTTRFNKELEADVRAEFRVQVANDYPAATEEGINAIVTRLMYEKNLAARIPDDKELTLRPDIGKTL